MPSRLKDHLGHSVHLFDIYVVELHHRRMPADLQHDTLQQLRRAQQFLSRLEGLAFGLVRRPDGSLATGAAEESAVGVRLRVEFRGIGGVSESVLAAGASICCFCAAFGTEALDGGHFEVCELWPGLALMRRDLDEGTVKNPERNLLFFPKKGSRRGLKRAFFVVFSLEESVLMSFMYADALSCTCALI